MLTQAADKSISVLDSVILSLVGFLIVFIALVALIVAIKIITLLAERKKKETDVRTDKVDDSDKSENIISAPVTEMIPSAGSLGELDLYDVDDYTAAIIMAIVADDLKVPLTTLRFKSIRQIEIEEVK